MIAVVATVTEQLETSRMSYVDIGVPNQNMGLAMSSNESKGGL